jgi:hypothetical protein
MRMPAAMILSLLVSSVIVAIGACANPDGKTPMCNNNVGPNGIKPDPNGCQGYAVCVGPDGGVAPPATCCISPDGGLFAGNDLAECLHGYGDPSCAYLLETDTMMGMNVVYTCSSTPPGTGAGGSGAGGGGTGGGGPTDGGDGG